MDDSLQSLLHELERFGADNDALVSERREKMLNITPDTGEFLAILAQGMNARRVLEIGTSNGYSTLWLADAVQGASGSVVTVEVSSAKAEMARHNFERSGLSSCVRQLVMDAGEFLREQSPSQFDLVFLDANREQYVTWWPLIQRALEPGGLLVVDNAVSHASEMAAFSTQVRATAGWRSVVVPIGKGEFVSLKPTRYGMSTLVTERDVFAESVRFSDDAMTVHLDDGRVLSIPLTWYPRLLHGTRKEREEF